MRTESILPEEIKEFKYYVRKLPLYLQNSYGFIEHYKIWYDLMMGENIENAFDGVVPTAETLLYLFDIFDADFLQTIASLEGSGSSPDDFGSVSDILDKIGSIFGVKRNFSISYYDDGEYFENVEVSLDNKDFLILIKGQIIKNYYDGTYSQMTDYYTSSGLRILLLSSSEQATAYLYLIEIEDSNYSYSENIRKVFLSGLLNIESMGIQYRQSILILDKILIWDKEVSGTYTGWDYGEWVI